MNFVSPWTCSHADYLNNKIYFSVYFNQDNYSINGSGLVGYRDPQCVYNKIIIGNTDGSGITIDCTGKDNFILSVEELSNLSLNSFNDFMGNQITFMK